MQLFDDFDDYANDSDYEDLPECYTCGEVCYWEGRKLYDLETHEQHICISKRMSINDDFDNLELIGIIDNDFDNGLEDLEEFKNIKR